MAQWYVSAKRADFQGIADKFGITPVTARVIRNRDVVGEEEIRRYLSGTVEDLYPPELLRDMDKAVGLLLDRIEKGTKIRVIGDYDADGVCSAAILIKGLSYCGALADAAIPHRVKDGYGLNDSLIEEAHADGVKLIVTCDNGIAAGPQIAHAHTLGMEAVVTDHHEVPFRETDGGKEYQLPEAEAVIDPKREDCPYPEKRICGAVVAFKLIQRLTEKWDERRGDEGGRRRALLGELLQLAAFATVCDVVELQGENRIVVREGLRLMQNTCNTGLRALIRANGMDGRALTAYHIGFVLGPCLNATGRLDTAARALELLCCGREDEAAGLAEDLKQLNDSRKEMTTRGVEEAVALAERERIFEDKVMILYLPDCHESLAGIIAGKIRERYGRPSFVLTGRGGMVKGSGRSIEGYSMFEQMTGCGDLMEKYGGHRMAAGLTIKEENIPEFRRRMNENCGLEEKDFEEKIHIDVPMPLSYADIDFVKELALLEPFGMGNPRPLFARKGISLLRGRILGKNRNVGKYTVEDETGKKYDMVYFGDLEEFNRCLSGRFGPEAEAALYGGGCRLPLDIAYYPSLDVYQGRESVQIVLQHYKFS